MRKFDAIERALSLASMMGASIGMGYSHRQEVEAYKEELRKHLTNVIPGDPLVVQAAPQMLEALEVAWFAACGDKYATRIIEQALCQATGKTQWP